MFAFAFMFDDLRSPFDTKKSEIFGFRPKSRFILVIYTAYNLVFKELQKKLALILLDLFCLVRRCIELDQVTQLNHVINVPPSLKSVDNVLIIILLFSLLTSTFQNQLFSFFWLFKLLY